MGKSGGKVPLNLTFLVSQEQWVPRHRPLIWGLICGWAWEGWVRFVNLKVKFVLLSVLPTQDAKVSWSFGALNKFQMGQCQCVWDPFLYLPPTSECYLQPSVDICLSWARLWLHRISPGGSDWAPFPELFLKTEVGSAVPGLRTGEIIPTSYELRTFLGYYKLCILPTFAHVILFSLHLHFVR